MCKVLSFRLDMNMFLFFTKGDLVKKTNNYVCKHHMYTNQTHMTVKRHAFEGSHTGRNMLIEVLLLMVQKSHSQPPGMVVKPCK